MKNVIPMGSNIYYQNTVSVVVEGATVFSRVYFEIMTRFDFQLIIKCYPLIHNSKNLHDSLAKHFLLPHSSTRSILLIYTEDIN
jgi:hypothetical protein